MKKISTAGVKQTKNFSDQKLTIGLDLGDRSSWYCGLDEAGEVLLEQRPSTTPKAL
jgi:transposase